MDTRNIRLTPAELQAVEEHKYYMSQQRGREVTIEEAIGDFVRACGGKWRREKMHRDCHDQIREIEKHKYLRSMEEGRDIGREKAATEWCTRHAAIWRRERESLERHGFRTGAAVAGRHVHVRPSSELAAIARDHDADLYVHKEPMPVHNFMLGEKRYLNVKSVLGLLSLGVEAGDRLEFLATGAQAVEALQAAADFVSAS